MKIIIPKIQCLHSESLKTGVICANLRYVGKKMLSSYTLNGVLPKVKYITIYFSNSSGRLLLSSNIHLDL